jgi:hypothetical protein
MTKTYKVLSLLSVLVLSSCGQSDNGPNPKELQVNARYLNTKAEGFSQTNSGLLIQIANELELYSQEEILFREKNRSVVVRYGPLDGSLLGLTECTFYSDNIRTNCVITIKQDINPDLASSNSERLNKERLFYGVLRHEIGHAFGMGHNLVDTNNLMYPIFNFAHVENQTVLLKFINDLTNFRYNGAASGIRTIFDDRNSNN